MGKAEKHVCVRECYYREQRWKPGDILPEWIRPNRHFSPEGTAEIEHERRVVLGPGDDPRPSKQIRDDLKRQYGFDAPADASRRDLFLAWQRLSAGAGVPMSASDLAPVPTESELPDELAAKPFDNWTPDDIDRATAREIASEIARRTGQRINHIGTSKAELLGRGIRLEEG